MQKILEIFFWWLIGLEFLYFKTDCSKKSGTLLKLIQLNISKILGSIARITLAGNNEDVFFNRMANMLTNLVYSIGILNTMSTACDQFYEETDYNFECYQQHIFSISTNFDANYSTDISILLAALSCTLSTVEIADVS